MQPGPRGLIRNREAAGPGQPVSYGDRKGVVVRLGWWSGMTPSHRVLSRGSQARGQ